MKIWTTNSPTYYQNPTTDDFINKRVDLEINSISPIWKVWNEEDGILNIDRTTDIAHLDLPSNNPPAQIKVETEDGILHYFYKDTFSNIILDNQKKTYYRWIYQLNKWETYIKKLFLKQLRSNTPLHFIQKQSDEILFYWDLTQLITKQSLLVAETNEKSIREALAIVFNVNQEYINDYYDINLDSKTFTIIPKKKDDGTYYFCDSKPTEPLTIKWYCEIGDPTKNPIQPNLLRYCINLSLQKYLSDTTKTYNDKIRLPIGGKSITEIYEANGIMDYGDDMKETITFSHYQTGDSSNNSTLTLKQIDDLFKNNYNQFFDYIVCKSATLKKWSGSVGNIQVESLSDETTLKIPMNETYIKFMNSIIDIIEPPGQNINNTKNIPRPWNVQLDPISTQTKYSDEFIDDTPPGLLFWTAQNTINNHLKKFQKQPRALNTFFQYANIYQSSTADFIGQSDFNINGGKTTDGTPFISIIFLRSDANMPIQIQLNNIQENNSLDLYAHNIIKKKIERTDDFQFNAILLHPKYQFEQIVYDNDSFINIDFSKINYDLPAATYNDSGITLFLNLCYLHQEIYFYNFQNKITNYDLNNDYDEQWNNQKSNLRYFNKRTKALLGTNANNLLNGEALSSYTANKSNTNTFDNRTANFAISEAEKTSSAIGGALQWMNPKNWLPWNAAKKMFGEANELMGMTREAINYDYQNRQQQLKFNDTIENIRSQTNIEVSPPYVASLGKTEYRSDGKYYFQKYLKKIKPWDEQKLLYEVRANGYIYDSLQPLKHYDNRITHNYFRILSDTNITQIRNELKSNLFYEDKRYINEFISWMILGMRIWKKPISDILTTINYENIIYPQVLGKQNLGSVITIRDLGIIFGDTEAINDISKNNYEYIKKLIQTEQPLPVFNWENIDFSNDYQTLNKPFDIIITANTNNNVYYGQTTIKFMILNERSVDKLVFYSNKPIANVSINDIFQNGQYLDDSHYAIIHANANLSEHGSNDFAFIMRINGIDTNDYAYQPLGITTKLTSNFAFCQIGTFTDDRPAETNNPLDILKVIIRDTGAGGTTYYSSVTIYEIFIYERAAEPYTPPTY